MPNKGYKQTKNHRVKISRTLKKRHCSERIRRNISKVAKQLEQEIDADISQQLLKRRYKTKGREENLKRFGITLHDYNRILKLQNGCCGICNCKPSQVKNRFAVDHDHKTGKIRGLLCVSCNNKLGWFEIHRKEVEQYLKNIKNIQREIR